MLVFLCYICVIVLSTSDSLQGWSSAVFLSNISKFCPDLVKNGVLLQNIDPCLSTFREFHQRRPIFSRTVWDASHSQSARYYRVAPIIYLGKSVPGMDTQKQYLLVLLPVSLGRAQTKQHSSEWYHLCFQKIRVGSRHLQEKARKQGILKTYPTLQNTSSDGQPAKLRQYSIFSGAE